MLHTHNDLKFGAFPPQPEQLQLIIANQALFVIIKSVNYPIHGK